MMKIYSVAVLLMSAAGLSLAEDKAVAVDVSLTDAQIVVGANAPELEQYAAKELQRYLYALSGSLFPVTTDSGRIRRTSFVIGQPKTNRKIAEFVRAGRLEAGPGNPGEQGYVLRKISFRDKFSFKDCDVIAIAGSDEAGCLYGVYGLLEDHYDVGFYLSGDVLPDRKAGLLLPPALDERKKPAVKIRGFLPWTNFPQSPSAYSWQDWQFIIDQMAKMRMNFLHIHNYNETGLLPLVSAVPRHNEMFHNFTCKGFTSRVWMPTVRSGHFWWGPPWTLSQYRFSAKDLFDDYDFGADCGLHNESLSNEQVSRKGASLFRKVIAHAHKRGVKVGLGLDINLVPTDYKTSADDPEVVAARANQIADDYPDLDYMICFQSENTGHDQKAMQIWRKIFKGMYDILKVRSPRAQFAVSGWGLNPNTISEFPEDVVCAPISAYSDGCENGAIYGQREYWGCPWLERDGNSSQYYYPYNVHLSNTIKAWKNRASNMNGFYCLTWRLTDSIEPKMSFVSKAPWDNTGKYADSRSAYREYARVCYGEKVADRIAEIINQNEPFASAFAECGGTPGFGGGGGQAEFDKAVQQLAVIDEAVASASSPTSRARLQLLRCRIAAARDHIALNMKFGGYAWNDLPGEMSSWVDNFTYRVCDVSSLGNVTSIENRFVQLNYVGKENQLRKTFAVQPPAGVEGRGTRTGAVITWQNLEPKAKGFNVYRDKTRLNDALLSATTDQYEDRTSGKFCYTVTATSADGVESPQSIPVTCLAGPADNVPPHIVVVSPPTSAVEGQPVWIKARILENRTYENVSATLYYRVPGARKWNSMTMSWRARAVFAAAIPARAVGKEGLEYYIEATDGDNAARFPASAPAVALSLIACPERARGALAGGPQDVKVDNKTLAWSAPSSGEVFWYRIYRSEQADFIAGPATFLTYVDKATTSFADNGNDFADCVKDGRYYYRITAVDKKGNESYATKAVAVDYVR